MHCEKTARTYCWPYSWVAGMWGRAVSNTELSIGWTNKAKYKLGVRHVADNSFPRRVIGPPQHTFPRHRNPLVLDQDFITTRIHSNYSPTAICR